MWKPTAQEGLWFHGGNLAQSRHYSRYLALQLKARMEGSPRPSTSAPRCTTPNRQKASRDIALRQLLRPTAAHAVDL